MMKTLVVLLLLTTLAMVSCNQSQQKQETITRSVKSSKPQSIPLSRATLQGNELIKTNFGDIQLTETYISKESLEKLNDQLELQRAVEIYQWSLPLTTFQMWYNSHKEVYGGSDLSFVENKSFNEKLGILTANSSTTYVIGWADLSKTGPLVIDYPAGLSTGAVLDFYQVSLGEIGLSGADQGQGGKYLIVPNGYELSALNTKDYFVIRATTSKIMIGTRFLSPDEEDALTMKANILIGRYGEPLQPAKFISNTNKRFAGTPYRGLKYFELLHQFIQNEPQREADKIFYTYLNYLGIENGKPFKPTERQKSLLAEGANLGELMCRSNQIRPRKDRRSFETGSWHRQVSNFPYSNSEGAFYFLDESNQWYYEAVSITSGVQLKIPGFRTTTHLTTKEDKDGNFLFGSNTYKLHLPASLSNANFWSLVLYSENTRCFIDNKNAVDKMRATSVDSRDQNLVMNSDGSIDLYIGPVAPEGKKNNWLQTNVGEGWFPLFRTYGTQQYLLDNQWQPGEFEKIR